MNLQKITPSVVSGYETAYLGAVLIDRSEEGRFELYDRDRLDLLQRMSTNDLRGLVHGQGRSTVLTTALARIIDRLILYERGDGIAGVTLAVCGVGRITTVRAWLQRHIFFQDKVQTRDVTAETFQFGLFGPHASAIAGQFLSNTDDIEVLPLHHFFEFTLVDETVLVARTYSLAGGGFTFIGPSVVREAFLSVFDQVSSNVVINVVLGTDADILYDLLRIDAAVPSAGYELSEEYLPLEAALWDSISFKKGCYTGQEIIARMESRHQLARTMVRLTISAFVPTGSKIVRASQPDHSVGVLTSVTVRPDNTIVALGYVKFNSVDDDMITIDSGGNPVTITNVRAAGWGTIDQITV